MGIGGLEERFWSKVNFPTPSGCWEWQDALDVYGYGRFWDGKNSVKAHRYAYQLVVGPIPEGKVIDHLCRNRGCVNPYHMEPVTIRENIQRGVKATQTHCKRGHPLTPDNLYTNRFMIKNKVYETRKCKECKRILQDERITRLKTLVH